MWRTWATSVGLGLSLFGAAVGQTPAVVKEVQDNLRMMRAAGQPPAKLDPPPADKAKLDPPRG